MQPQIISKPFDPDMSGFFLADVPSSIRPERYLLWAPTPKPFGYAPTTSKTREGVELTTTTTTVPPAGRPAWPSSHPLPLPQFSSSGPSTTKARYTAWPGAARETY